MAVARAYSTVRVIVIVSLCCSRLLHFTAHIYTCASHSTFAGAKQHRHYSSAVMAVQDAHGSTQSIGDLLFSISGQTNTLGMMLAGLPLVRILYPTRRMLLRCGRRLERTYSQLLEVEQMIKSGVAKIEDWVGDDSEHSWGGLAYLLLRRAEHYKSAIRDLGKDAYKARYDLLKTSGEDIRILMQRPENSGKNDADVARLWQNALGEPYMTQTFSAYSVESGSRKTAAI